MAYSDIKDPSAYFQTKLYTGNGSTQSITNDGNSDMQPDWVWIKSRSNASWHSLQDSSRGATKTLFTNTNNAEVTYTDAQTSFDSDGFSLGADASGGSVNVSSRTYAAWQWKANGGTTSSNTDGTITSTVQANTTAGFSIITYTGNATNNATVGHGLGVAPSVIIIKDLTDGSVWGVWHKDLTDAGYRLTLSSTAAESNDSGFMGGGNRTLPTSSVFSLGGGGGGNGTNAYIAYCFAEKQGYSKFGTYTGISSTDGRFVYTGFKPAWVMIKSSDTVTNWRLFDNKRSGFNGDTSQLYPNLANAEDSAGDQIDLLSNGFKNRAASTDQNGSGQTYIYMAFAENPFVAGGIPTTAR